MNIIKTQPGSITHETQISPESNCLRQDDPDSNYAVETLLPTRPNSVEDMPVTTAVPSKRHSVNMQPLCPSKSSAHY